MLFLMKCSYSDCPENCMSCAAGGHCEECIAGMFTDGAECYSE